MQGKVTLVTLGPMGTCHERAAIEYIAFHGVEDFEIRFLDGLEQICGKENAFLVQCSARRLVNKVAERYWEEGIGAQSKPIAAEELLAGRYEAGLTQLKHQAAHPDELPLVEEISEIDTTWVVYGTKKRFEGDVIGIPSPELFGPEAPVIP
jgi:hypothetical protein